ncbi:MAG: M20 family metallopeptidase [bacterium]
MKGWNLKNQFWRGLLAWSLLIGWCAPTIVTAQAAPDFETLVTTFLERTIADRRWFHANPELSLREFQTQAHLRDALLAMPGVELVPGEWGTGLVALLTGEQPGPLIGWRADMDGLPITEITGLPYASSRCDTLSGGREVGVMHACGHDLHLSITLGAVRVLAELREQMAGSLLLIFQPAEEIGEGARNMLQAGVFTAERRPLRVFSLHDHPDYACGDIAVCPGGATANVDGFVLTVRGHGGHGAYPHHAVDPVILAAQMVLAFNGIVAREMDVNNHCVITVGSIQGGAQSNIIPDEVVLQATVRSHDEPTRQALRTKITRTVDGLAAAAGAPAPRLEYYFGTPAGLNDPVLVAEVREVAGSLLGPEHVITHAPQMIGEDFALFARAVPGCQFLLGVAPPSGTTGLHSPEFNPDEGAVAVGMRLVAEILWDQLQRCVSVAPSEE